MPSALDQKVALVTGSGRGIGQAIAKSLREQVPEWSLTTWILLPRKRP